MPCFRAQMYDSMSSNGFVKNKQENWVKIIKWPQWVQCTLKILKGLSSNLRGLKRHEWDQTQDFFHLPILHLGMQNLCTKWLTVPVAIFFGVIYSNQETEAHVRTDSIKQEENIFKQMSTFKIPALAEEKHAGEFYIMWPITHTLGQKILL